MKKSFFVVILIAAISTSSFAEEKEVPLSPTNIPVANDGHHHSRTSQYIPEASIENHTLFFNLSCIGCSIQLLQDDIVVYTDVVNEDGKVILPDSLSGVYQLQLQFGSIIFEGEIEL